jgi:nitrite reductase (NADH) large subunit
MSTKLKLMGVDVASIGDAHGATAGSRSYQFTDERRRSTRSWWCPTAASSCSAR